ncbi:MAG: T9SS type A sorting domain-containing protein, partial [Bacteroidetes bacterium]|nr:T9SS type A sorting domain-containing protein [Bacteroidota bacterium]
IVVINESFDGTMFPPLGWTSDPVQPTVDPENYCERVTAGSNPFAQPAAPHSGPGMARFRCGYMTTTEKAFIATRALDYSNMVAGDTADITFWVYRDNNSLTVDDSLTLSLTTTNIYTGPNGYGLQAEQLSPPNFSWKIGRNYNDPPATTVQGWYQYRVRVPYAYINTLPLIQRSNLYLTFVFSSAHTVATGGNIYIDDVSIQTFPSAQTTNSSMVNMIYQNTANIPPNSTNNPIVGIVVNVTGGDDVTPGNYYTVANFSFSTIGSSAPCTDLQNAKLWWTGNTATFNGTANAVQIGTTVAALCATNYTFTPAASFRFQNGPNYFWITYDVKNAPPAVPGNCVDAELNSVTVVKGTPTTLTPTTGTLPGCRPIDVSYCGGATPYYSTGTSWLGGSYTNNDYIQHVTLVGEPLTDIISNGTNCCGPPISPWFGGPAPFSNHPPDYEKFAPGPNHTTTLMHGQTYSISLKVGTWYSSNYIAAWIDFNHDGVFSLAERIAMSGPLSANGTYTVNFTVPTGYAGNTFLRVREVYANSNIDPCASATYGETEDYVVTIIPACALLPPGYQKLWIGVADDNWDTPANWCPVTPPKITENTLIPGGSPFRPVIYEGTTATAKVLTIAGNDTVTVKVYKTGSLTVADSMNIKDPASALIVVSNYTNKAILSNGTLTQTTPPYHPFNGASRSQRCQFLYTSAELAAKGMVTGDSIYSIEMHIDAFTPPSNAYTNFNIRYYYAPVTFLNFGTNMANVKLADFAVGSTPITVYTNPSETIAGAGNHAITLTNPIPVDLNYQLVIDICYDHTPGGGQNSFYTTTLGAKKYIQIYSTAPTVTSACDFSPTLRGMVLGAYPIGTTTFTLGSMLQSTLPHLKVGMRISASTPAGIFPAGTIITAIAGNVITVSNPSLTAIGTGNQMTFIVNGTLISTDNNCYTLQRPNLTLNFKRPFKTFQASVAGNWTNNGTFIAGQSNFSFVGSSLQRVLGTQVSTFYDFSLSKLSGGSTVELWKDMEVTDTLNLYMGRIRLNGNPTAIRTLSLLNGNPSSVTQLNRTFGNLVAENNPPYYGNFRWQMKTPSAYPFNAVIPFADAIGNSIPMDYTVNAGTPDITVTTYHTIPNNTPIPTGVNNIYQNTWIAPPATDNSPYMVDRFWQVDEAGTGVNRDLTFRWTAAENAASGASPYRAQVYNPTGSSVGTGAWMWPFSLGQTNPTGTSVKAPNITYTNTWAVVRELQPLPVKLLMFDARPYKDKEIICNWTTATEENSDYFTVERSVDGINFEKAGTVKAAGNSNEQRNYKFVDTNPYRGVSFYRLTQTDFDGKTENFEKVAVNLSIPAAPISVYPVPAKDQVVISVDPNVNLENAVLTVYDLTGRKMITQTVAQLRGLGTNIFKLPLTSLTNGMYYFDIKVEETSLGNGKFIVEK